MVGQKSLQTQIFCALHIGDCGDFLVKQPSCQGTEKGEKSEQEKVTYPPFRYCTMHNVQCTMCNPGMLLISVRLWQQKWRLIFRLHYKPRNILLSNLVDFFVSINGFYYSCPSSSLNLIMRPKRERSLCTLKSDHTF